MGIVKGHKIKDIVTSPFYSLKPLGFPQLLASRKWRLLLYHLMRSNNILCSCWCNFQVIPATTMSLAARKRACCNNKTGVSTAQLVWCISSYRHLSKAAEASASPESPCGSSGRAGPCTRRQATLEVTASRYSHSSWGDRQLRRVNNYRRVTLRSLQTAMSILIFHVLTCCCSSQAAHQLLVCRNANSLRTLSPTVENQR